MAKLSPRAARREGPTGEPNAEAAQVEGRPDAEQDEPRPRVRSFDVFDTLIARRGIEPHQVFHRVAAALQMPEFPQIRVAAEAAVSTGPYTLADIYQRLSTSFGVAPEMAERLKEAEVEVELDEVMPIAENITRVRDGDLLISDMYLGDETIRRLLAKAGLTRNVGLVVTADGKRSGAIWPHVAAKVEIQEHLGDNHHSDVAMPSRFGIPASHTTTHAPSVVEQWLLNLGLRDLPQLLREARLTTWHPNPIVRRLQLAQVQLNFPILALSSIRLVRLAQATEAERLLFASRDCNAWLPLHREIAGQLGDGDREAEYFFTSRAARLRPSADYLAYARDRLGRSGMVVDVAGTGWSMANLFQRLGLSGRILFFVHWMKMLDQYVAKSPLPDTCRVDAVVDPSREGVSNVHLEMCNYAEHGSVRSVRLINGAATPVFDDECRSPALLEMVAAQQSAFALATDLLRSRPLVETLTLGDDVIKELVAQLYIKLSEDRLVWDVFGVAHMGEDARFMNSLAEG